MHEFLCLRFHGSHHYLHGILIVHIPNHIHTYLLTYTRILPHADLPWGLAVTMEPFLRISHISYSYVIHNYV